jgi:hypothetical protein
MGRYIGGVIETWQVSGGLKYLLVILWLLYPTAIVTVFHPADAIGFEHWLEGLPIPREVFPQTLVAGGLWAVAMLFVLSVFQFVVILLIYRRTGFFVRLWPLALILTGGIANGIWWLAKGYFDPWGAMAGLTPVVATIGCFGVCEQLGAAFVFGPGPKPHYEGF